MLVEHNGAAEWRRTVGAQLLALIGRLWLETHSWDPAFKHNHHAIAVNTDEEEVGKLINRISLTTVFYVNENSAIRSIP